MPKHWFKPLEFFNDLYPELHTIIKNRRYNKLLKHLEEDNTFSQVFCGQIFSIPDKDLVILHVTDEQLGRNIYSSLVAGNELPDNFDLLKFVSLKNEERVVFAVYYNVVKTSLNDPAIKEYLTSFPKLIDAFIEFASTEECSAHINYTEFFASHRYWSDEPMVISLMHSITSGTVNPETDENFIEIIDSLFSRTQPLYDSFRTSSSLYKDIDYCKYLRKGISLAKNSFSCMPAGLFANIIKYLLDNKAFTSPRELFDFNANFENVDIFKDTFIFDSDRFNRSLKFNGDCNEFVSFSLDNLNFLKLKDNSKKEQIQNLICQRDSAKNNNVGPLDKLIFINSSNEDVYLYVDADGEVTSSLTTYISKNYSERKRNIDNFVDLLENFVEAFSDIAKSKKLHFNKDVNYLNCISISENNNFYFTDLSDLKFEANESTTTFDIDLAVIQIINAYFKERNYIKFSSLYYCLYSKRFLRLLPPDFTVKLFDYISNHRYEAAAKPTLTQGIIDKKYRTRITLAEDIEKDEYSHMYAFFSDVDLSVLNPGLAKYFEENPANPNCISLEDKLNSMNCRSLNTKTLDQLFKENMVSLLGIDEVIISPNLTCNNEYKIVGVKWNHDSLVSLHTALENKLINTKQLYCFLASLLDANLNGGAVVHKIDSDDMLISLTSYAAVFNNTALLDSRRRIVYEEKYYNYLIQALNSLNLLDGYDIFEFRDICENNFRIAVNNLVPCRYHEGHWRLGHKPSCPVCDKIYYFGKSDVTFTFRQKTLFASDDCSFSLYDEDILCCCDSKYLSQVETGLTNNLYQSFVGLTPERLVVVKQNFGASLKTVGIKYCNNFSFDSGNIKLLTEFKHVPRLKAVLTLYEKVLPRIMNNTFVALDKGIFDYLFMHKNYRGEVVIPNIAMLDCETILSKDESLKTTKRLETLQMFSNFLTDYLLSDDSFTLEKSYTDEFAAILKDIKDCSFNPLLIKHYMSHFAKLCSIHNVHFADGSICHECLKEGISENDIIVKPKKYFDGLKKQKSQYDGGEANLYPYSDTQVQKLFKGDVSIKFKSKILGKSLTKKEQINKFNESNPDIKIITADKLLYMHENNVLTLKGFVQEFVDGAFKISSLKEKSFVVSQGYLRKDIVEILMKVCKGIEFIHSIGGYIGDLNGGNILIKGKMVYFIDIDGMSFDEVRNSVFTLSYIYPPSAENKNITADDDWYSLAVQAFYYLTYSHPFRGVSYNPRVSDNEIERMKDRTSVLGKHNIEPPSISIGWDFLPVFIHRFFLKTFEGTQRTSMLSALKQYYDELTEKELKFRKVTHQREVALNISEHTYIDKNGNLVYKENELLKLPYSYQTYWNDNFVFISTSGISYLLNEMTGELTEFDIGEQVVPLELYKNFVFTKSANGNVKVYQKDKENGNVVSYFLPECTDSNPLAFSIQDEGKFIFLYKNVETGRLEIAGNKMEPYAICDPPVGEIVDTDILYDASTKKWLVTISSETSTLAICVSSKTGECSPIELNNALSNNKYFYRNTLYYVDDRQICYYNITNSRLNIIPCDIAEKSSLIKREGNVFVINNRDSVYLYEKHEKS